MSRRPILLTLVMLIAWCYQFVPGDVVASDEHTDVGHDEDVHPNTLTESNGDALDMDVPTNMDVFDTNFETNWDVQDNYEDADWHPPSSLLETLQPPEAPPVIRSGTTGNRNTAKKTFNRTIGRSAKCGEYSSQLMSNGQCRLTATLPPVAVGGTSQKRCPDMFRCTDDVSHWLHENQNRKEQLEELKETMSELQEELRNHRHRVNALDLCPSLSLCLDTR